MASSQAEVDLIVNATRTLPQLERDLDRVLNAAQADMSDLDVNAVLRSTQSLNDIERDLSRIIRQAGDDADPVVLQAAIRQRDEIQQLQRDLNSVVDAVNADGSVDPLLARVGINVPEAIADLDDDVRRVVRAAQATAPDIEIETRIDNDRIQRLILSLGTATRAVAGLSAAVVGLSAATGAVAPLLASAATAVQNIVPAAAVATTGIVAVSLAMGTLKLGALGVSDALEEAFSSDADAKKLAEAMKGLAPSARDTVKEIISLKKEFKALQIGVQDRLFRNFDQAVRALATSALPQIRTALNQTATTFNAMGIGVAQAAVRLSANGTLGTALKSATNGLNDLKAVPGQLTTAFVQLAAAAGPSFERITAAVARLATTITDRLNGAFESGGLQDAIENAIDATKQLGRSFGNVFSGIGNIIKAVSSGGEGLFATFERVSQAFEDLTADKGFQEALRALASVSATVSKTVLPLLAQALKIVGAVLVELSEPAKELVRLVGAQLGTILTALRPVLLAVAKAFGGLLGALGPIIELAGELIAGILPVLTPLFEALGRVFVAMTPAIQAVTDILGAVLGPILAALPGLVAAFVEPMAALAEQLFPILTEQLQKMAPDFIKLGESLGQLLVTVTPIIAGLTQMYGLFAVKLIPIITGPLLGVLALLAKGLAAVADVFTKTLTPAAEAYTAFMNGDFLKGNANATASTQNMGKLILQAIKAMVVGSLASIGSFQLQLQAKLQDAVGKAILQFARLNDRASAYLRALPGRARDAMGDLGATLYSAGQDLIRGFTRGIQDQIGSAVDAARGAANSVVGAVKGALGIHSPSTVMAELGGFTMDGFIVGVQKAIPRLRQELEGIALTVPSLAAPSPVTSQAGGSMLAPAVYVSIGNEAVDQYVTTRVTQIDNSRQRTAAQGVRI